MGVWYTTREAVKAALDIKNPARVDAQIDRAIESASEDVEGCLHRKFYPWQGTKYFDWPNRDSARSWRLWFNQHEAISITTLVAGGVTVAASDYFLEPANDGPPYDRVELDLSSNTSFTTGSTHQRDIAITGLWGYRNDEATAGQLNGAINSSVTTLIVSNGAAVGVGNILRIDNERLLVLDKSAVDTTQNLGGAGLTVQNADATVPVSDGTAFHVGEILLIGSERMQVLDIAGNNLTVKRGVDGSATAAHSTGADVYAWRSVAVTRAALGTQAASHLDAAPVLRHDPPALVRSLTLAYALNQFEQETSAYARVAGSGDNANEYIGRGLYAIEKRAKQRHGRQLRTRAV